MSTNDHLAALGRGNPAAVPSPPALGSVAPDFELPATGGRELKLSELVKSHRATIIAFYVLDFTPG